MSAEVQSVIQLTPSIRKKASANIWQRRDEAFDMAKLHELIRETLQSADFADEESVFERLRQIDLNQIIKESPGLNKYFTCTFFVKRFAWISQNEKGEYRYFSKIKEGYGYYALDLFDLIAILLNQTTKKTIEHLQATYQVESMSAWDRGEKQKYEENIQIVQSLVSEKTPALKRLLQGGADILSDFLEYGREKVNGKHFSTGEHAVFFLSISHFKERYYPEKSISTLNQWVNLFAVLGLVEKTATVPMELQVEAEKQQALKKKHNHVSFYSVPHFETVLEKAELRASLLVENRISYHQITKAVVMSLFGHAVHDHVYVQKTHGRKRKANQKDVEMDAERLHTFFHASLAETGLVVKKDLQEASGLSRTAFTQQWSKLVADTESVLSVPTQAECRKFNLSHRQVVARLPETKTEKNLGHVWKNEHCLPWDNPAQIAENTSFIA